jgi:DnaD/phage-associated family protein
MFEMHRRPTTQQKQYMDAWQTAGYSMELLQYAYELTIENTEKLNFKYLNAILENWQKQGITTVEQAKALSNSTAVKKKSTGKGNEKLTSQEIDEMNDYLSVVNRFRKE